MRFTKISLAVASVVFSVAFFAALQPSAAQARELLDDTMVVQQAPAIPATAIIHTVIVMPTAAPAASPTAQTSQPVPSDPMRSTPSSRGGARPNPDISTPQKFVDAVAPAAQESQRQTGVPASVTIAQAILESEWGRSDLSTRAQNYFGIKAFGQPGPAGTITLDTLEVLSGRNAVIADAFKAYNSLYESVIDHGVWLRDNPRYADAFKTTDPMEFARRIHSDGYATDPGYCSKLGALIDKYGLKKYDAAPEAGK